MFQELWQINDDGLPIALHHGSLDAGQRRKVEVAMSEGACAPSSARPRSISASTGAAVDLVMSMSARRRARRDLPSASAANHRLDESSRALLVLANRFEVLECVAAVAAAREGAQDTSVAPAALDVLAHILGSACAGLFPPMNSTKRRVPQRPMNLTRETFDRVRSISWRRAATLKSCFDRFAKIRQTKTASGASPPRGSRRPIE